MQRAVCSLPVDEEYSPWAYRPIHVRGGRPRLNLLVTVPWRRQDRVRHDALRGWNVSMLTIFYVGRPLGRWLGARQQGMNPRRRFRRMHAVGFVSFWTAIRCTMTLEVSGAW